LKTSSTNSQYHGTDPFRREGIRKGEKNDQRYAIAAGLPDDLTESLCKILMEGVHNETDEETLLKEFRKL
jgi:hypothetical protein